MVKPPSSTAASRHATPAASAAPKRTPLTSAWQPGHTLRDERIVALPGSMPAGAYKLLAGWYDPVSGVRLGAADAAGVAWYDAAVELGGFTIP